MIEYFTLLNAADLTKWFGLAFITIIIVGIVNASYLIEDMGDEEQ